jgi:glutamate synthase (NADPH/NADH) small chain
MGKERGFLEYGRADAGYRPVEQRRRDYRAVERRMPLEDVCRQAARCMDCGTPFCHACGCPLGNVIPEFNDHVYRRRWEDAVEVLLPTNPFPELTGRICPAPCEAACVLDINDQPVAIRTVELAIAETAFERGYIRPEPPAARRGGRVAVVGSGPAGLAAADRLNRLGYSVVVYENAARPGGILRYGIPDFKLEKWVVDRRVQLMMDEGVVFEVGIEIGRDISYRYLKDRFAAVVLTGGAREPRDLKVPGRDLAGIHFAMTFLVQQNMRLGGEPVAEDRAVLANGRRVLVIGGGDTGADCVGTAVRQGAESVRQFEILPEPPPARDPSTPWPAWPLKRRDSSSHGDGCERRWGVTAEEFLGRDGRVSRVRCVEVEWVPSAPGGLSAPRRKPGSEFTVDADLVLLSMGFVGPGPNQLVQQLGVALDTRGFLRRDTDGMTSVPGIFVAGDMTQGASLVVRAMADGLRVAEGVHRHLGG